MPGASWTEVISSDTVNATGVIYSSAIWVGSSKNFGCGVNIEEGTAPDIKVEYQVIMTKQQGDGTLVGAANTVERDYDWGVPASANEIFAQLNATGWSYDGFSPMVAPWIRMMVTGINANDTDTVVSVYLSEYHA